MIKTMENNQDRIHGPMVKHLRAYVLMENYVAIKRILKQI